MHITTEKNELQSVCEVLAIIPFSWPLPTSYIAEIWECDSLECSPAIHQHKQSKQQPGHHTVSGVNTKAKQQQKKEICWKNKT